MTKTHRAIHSMELELSFQTNKDKFRTMPKKHLTYVNQISIAQKWLVKISNSTHEYRSRIRAEVEKNNKLAKPKFTLDTKIYLTKTTRMELNAPITAKEFSKINKLYPNQTLIVKDRLYFQDTTSKLLYSFDIYSNSDIIAIEIEFNSNEEKASWVKPDWLKDIEVTNDSSK